MDYELIKPDAQDAYDPAPFLNYARARRTDKEERDPLVGDTVHWWQDGGCVAAVVTGQDWTAEGVREFLTVFPPRSLPGYLAESAPHDETKGEMTWHWPCGGH